MLKINLTGGKLTAEDWRKAIIIGILSLGLFSMADAQNNRDPWAANEIHRDTVISNSINVIEYTNRNGKQDFKATWNGKAINIANKDAEAILEGDDSAIILVTYLVEGQKVILPKKVIARKLRKNL